MTIDEAIKDIKENIQPFVGGLSLEMAIQALEENEEYKAIGTVKEFKTLKEKSVAKKVVYIPSTVIKIPHCPNCNMELTMSMYLKKFCNCGQKLDWQ